MASSLRILSIALGLFAWLVCVKAFNNTNSTGTHDVTAVVLDNETAFGVCVYPRSVSLHRHKSVKDIQLTFLGYILLPRPPPLLLHSHLRPVLKRPSLACSRCSHLRPCLLWSSSSARVPACLARAQSLYRKRQLGSLCDPQHRVSCHRTATELVWDIAQAGTKSSKLKRSESTENEQRCGNEDDRNVLGISGVDWLPLYMGADAGGSG